MKRIVDSQSDPVILQDATNRKNGGCSSIFQNGTMGSEPAFKVNMDMALPTRTSTVDEKGAYPKLSSFDAPTLDSKMPLLKRSVSNFVYICQYSSNKNDSHYNLSL
jgi:hypothetical protein